MPTYFFHCTDGADLILDRTGREVEDFELDSTAMGVAEDVAFRLPASFDWSGWVVSVYDADGRQVAIVPFAARDDTSTSIMHLAA
jgi:hypothetical protein